MSVLFQLLANHRAQMLEPGLMIGCDERLEIPLRLGMKGCLLVVRQSQERAERGEIFPLSSRQVLFQIRLVQGREGRDLMFGMQEAVFSEPGATGGRGCDVGGSIRNLIGRALECAAGRVEQEHAHKRKQPNRWSWHGIPPGEG